MSHILPVKSGRVHISIAKEGNAGMPREDRPKRNPSTVAQIPNPADPRSASAAHNGIVWAPKALSSLALQLCYLQNVSPLSWAGCTQACSFPWQIPHCSGTSKLTGCPLQLRFHFHRFVEYLCRDSLHGCHPCQHVA